MTYSRDIPVPDDAGRAIARRATELVGTPFRLHGRKCEGGLDCVGVVAEALACAGDTLRIPCDYTLRGEYLGRVYTFFDRPCFRSLDDENRAPGDILLCRTAERQMHFAIVVTQGIIHAHAGLCRVVLTPHPIPWPVIGRWRYIGD
jgi:cell wall-associated NlpC family hydrolase